MISNIQAHFAFTWICQVEMAPPRWSDLAPLMGA